MAQGLTFVRQKILSSIRGVHQAKALVVVMSDGESSDKEKLPEAAAQIRSKGVEIISVSIGSGNGEQLRSVVGPAGIILQVAEFKELSALVEKFHGRCSVETANNPYLLSTETKTATTTMSSTSTSSSTTSTGSTLTATMSSTSTSSSTTSTGSTLTGFPSWASAICIVAFCLFCACACTTLIVQVVCRSQGENDPPCWAKCLVRRVPSCIPVLSFCCCSLENYIFECTGDSGHKTHWALKSDQIPDCEMCYDCLDKQEVLDNNVLGNTDVSDEDNARKQLLP